MSTRRKATSTEHQKHDSLNVASQRPADLHDPFRTVADYTYDWESWLSPDGQLIWVNPAVERMTGYNTTECLEMQAYPLPLIHPDDREVVIPVLNSAREQTTGENLEFRLQHRSGEIRWASLCWQPMYDNNRQHLGYRTSVRDITERQQLRDQLRIHADHLEQLVEQRTLRLRQLEHHGRQMEKLAALGQLAAGVAHEINNPLAGVRNAFELIKSSLSPSHKHFDLLELIDREIERISGIVHQMYQLYRRSPQPATDFSLERIVDEVAYLLAKVADKHRVTLRCQSPEIPISVHLPEGEVKQILYNLIRNAIQASPAGDEVTVHLIANTQEACVSIEDNGPGIPPDLLPRIFDPFFSTKQHAVEAGMGLGLSVSHSLVESMGGRIEVDCEERQGCRFLVTFPRNLEDD